jgi:O-acetyl-ADP-ribose deacetylase (regulator of RNase III)
MKTEVTYGNIVAQPDVDAIVNSANAKLRFGSALLEPFTRRLAQN